MEPDQDRSPAAPRLAPVDRYECIAWLAGALAWCDANDAGFAAIHINQAMEVLRADGVGPGRGL